MAELEIDINLSTDFVNAYNRLQNEYGEKIASLNGFSYGQLSLTDFINNFIDKETVADASVDGNANVGQKDIVTLMHEMSKPHQKLLAFNKIFYELEKKYGFLVANEWMKNEWDGHLYMHDAHSSTFVSYCFSGDTKIMTKDGILPLKSLVGRQIMVLNKNHGWEEATVKNFGKAELRKLTLERYSTKKEIFVTGNHRWFVCNNDSGKRTILETDQLKPGMKIPFNTSKAWDMVEPSPFGIAHGFFMGDGSKSKNAKANFCGDKKDLIPYFTPANVAGDEHELSVGGIPEYFKDFPSIHETSSYLYGWLAGYFAADGCVDERGRCTLSSAKKENLEFVRNVMCVLGMPVNEIRYQDRVSNLTNEMGRIYTITISDEYLRSNFFIRKTHKDRFKENKDRHHRDWTVLSVETTDRVEDTFCAVVPGTESFTTDCNILTHNCFAYDLKDLAERGLFFIENFNAEPPKHLVTFVDFVKEFVSYNSNRTSGAVGLPNLIPYMYYFWDRDVKNNYYTETPIKYAKQNIQRLIYALNQPYTRDGIQSAFTNTSIFDHPYLEALFGGAEFPDGSFMIDEIEGIMDFQKVFLETMAEIRSKNMMTFPVNSISLLRQNGKFVDEEFARYACEHNRRWNDSNLFVDDSVTSLSNCCRLKNNISDLGFFNSIGGSALKVGSVKVSTINLARLALENHTEEDYLKALQKMVLLDCQVLDCVRYIIQRNVDKGLLKNFSLGLIDFPHLYNTIGVIGNYETMKTFGYTTMDEFGNTYYTKEAEEFGRKIFEVIHSTKDAFAKDKDYHINCEQIPGETAAVKLMQKDLFFFPETAVTDLPLYGNQFIPLGIKTTMQERIRIASMFDKFCNGGSILHINIEAPFNNPEQAWDMLNYVADAGVTYFAFNTKIQACKHNHAFFGKICPICGEPVETEYTRIVGFYTPVKTYSKERKEEVAMREWECINPS